MHKLIKKPLQKTATIIWLSYGTIFSSIYFFNMNFIATPLLFLIISVRHIQGVGNSDWLMTDTVKMLLSITVMDDR